MFLLKLFLIYSIFFITLIGSCFFKIWLKFKYENYLKKIYIFKKQYSNGLVENNFKSIKFKYKIFKIVVFFFPKSGYTTRIH